MLNLDSLVKMSVEVEDILNKYGYSADHDAVLFVPVLDEHSGGLTDKFLMEIYPLTQKETK